MADGLARVSYFRALAAMLHAGVPILRIFDFLAEQNEDVRLREVSAAVGTRLAQGVPLPRALASHPECFRPLAVQLVEVGYRTGSLTETLRSLAQDEEDRWTLRQRLTNALAYPLALCGVTVAVVVLLPPLVLHGFLEQVAAMAGELPFLTRLLIAVSAAMRSPWLWAGAVLTAVGVVTTWRSASRIQAVGQTVERLMRALPGVGHLVQTAVTLRFSQVLGTAMKAGLAADAALALAASASGSPLVEEEAPRMVARLREGASLRESVEQGELLSPLLYHAVHAGEQVGQTPALLASVNELMEAELDYRIENLLQVIEPLVLTLMGLTVGTIAIGALLPLIRLVEGL